MENEQKPENEENFKELLDEVSKIGTCIEELESVEIEDDEETEETTNESPKEKVTEDNIQQYVFDSATDLIDSSLYTLNKIKQSVTNVMDHKELTSLAELIKATTSSIEILNKVAMDNKKLQNARDIKKMDIEAKKQLSEGKVKNQTNILIASREEMMDKLLDKAVNNDKIIDIEE